MVTTPDTISIPDTLLQVGEERQTIVHCTVANDAGMHETMIRIWPSTWLIQENGLRRKLLFFERISPFPLWTLVRLPHRFTLVFEGLDDDCARFDLLEDIPQAGGFEVRAILRNQLDVYHVQI
jgi:hypothetical protein